MKELISIIIIPLIILMPVSAVASDIKDKQADKLTINIDSDPPGVRLSVNDIDVGETPLTLVYFEPGRYKITGKLKGYKNVKREIDVAAGETVNLEFVMEESKPGVPIIFWVAIGMIGTVMIVALVMKILGSMFAGGS